MNYRGALSFDWDNPTNGNDRDKIVAALVAVGWRKADTTSFAIETENLAEVWRGIEILARGASRVGLPLIQYRRERRLRCVQDARRDRKPSARFNGHPRHPPAHAVIATRVPTPRAAATRLVTACASSRNQIR